MAQPGPQPQPSGAIVPQVAAAAQPQSSGQFTSSSEVPQMSLPQVIVHVPQSSGQVEQFSVGPQKPSEQPGARQRPHSRQASAQQSPKPVQAASHMQFPPEPPHSQDEQASGSSRQSVGQAQESSPASQTKFPQLGGQTPQSAGQVEQSSPAPQTKSPQKAVHWPHVVQASMQQSP